MPRCSAVGNELMVGAQAALAPEAGVKISTSVLKSVNMIWPVGRIRRCPTYDASCSALAGGVISVSEVPSHSKNWPPGG